MSKNSETLTAVISPDSGALLRPAEGRVAPKFADLTSAVESVTTFKVQIEHAILADLRQRLSRIRWPDAGTVPDWSQGVPLDQAKILVDYWLKPYDMRRLERRMNAYPQFRTQIDGLGIHFIHVRSRHADALPLILTHGWPGCVLEFLDCIDRLVDPTAHGGSAADAFHVVIPSLPGFGFSDKPTKPGWGFVRIARAWDVLMKRLGYERYVAQGGDFGAAVTTRLSKLGPKGVAAIHLNLPLLFPPPPPGPNGYGPDERRAITQFQYFIDEGSGCAKIQSTFPQTLGYGLADSPVGQAMWIYEKFWRSMRGSGDPSDLMSMDAVLDNVMLYWITNTATSSARLYKESFQTDTHRVTLTGPVAISIFKGEIYTAPRSWAEQTFARLIYWNELPRGGHFAAMAQPQMFVEELRKAFRSLRP